MMTPFNIYVPARTQVVSIAVTTIASKVKKYCRLNLQTNGCSEISVGWNYTVKEFQLQEGDVWMFSFKDERMLQGRRQDPFAQLKVEMVKLEPESPPLIPQHIDPKAASAPPPLQ
jgi:hypothetical protein